MENDGPAGETYRSIFTLGFDPAKQRFVGTFVSACMTHLWPYDGALDAAHKVLTLDSLGPSFDNSGAMAKYHDIIEVIDHDQYLLKSEVQGADGSWTEFMTARYTRVKS